MQNEKWVNCYFCHGDRIKNKLIIFKPNNLACTVSLDEKHIRIFWADDNTLESMLTKEHKKYFLLEIFCGSNVKVFCRGNCSDIVNDLHGVNVYKL